MTPSPTPVAGCGTSALSHDLHELGYRDITSVDFSPACIAAMRARHARCPGLRWAVMDARALAFPDAAFDVVMEKGTLDALMAGEADPWDVSPRAAADVRRVLVEVRGQGGQPGASPHRPGLRSLVSRSLVSRGPHHPVRGCHGNARQHRQGRGVATGTGDASGPRLIGGGGSDRIEAAPGTQGWGSRQPPPPPGQELRG